MPYSWVTWLACPSQCRRLVGYQWWAGVLGRLGSLALWNGRAFVALIVFGAD